MILDPGGSLACVFQVRADIEPDPEPSDAERAIHRAHACQNRQEKARGSPAPSSLSPSVQNQSEGKNRKQHRQGRKRGIQENAPDDPFVRPVDRMSERIQDLIQIHVNLAHHPSKRPAGQNRRRHQDAEHDGCRSLPKRLPSCRLSCSFLCLIPLHVRSSSPGSI